MGRDRRGVNKRGEREHDEKVACIKDPCKEWPGRHFAVYENSHFR